MASNESNMTVAVVGGGPIGALAALYLAKRGWTIHLFESRPDPRLSSSGSGKSINLALSVRGIEAMRRVGGGVVEEVMRWVVPMRGRMIHTPTGEQISQAYSVTGECINSVSRARLNAHLLTRCESTPNITLHFSHPLADIDLDTGLLTFRHHASNSESWTFQADLIIGADGAYSRVRKTMMRKMRLKYEQEYIDHGYVELEIPAGEDGGWRMDPNHLHIWPKGGYMMIALPNPDHTFTVTLFMPWSRFSLIHTPSDLTTFFQTEFPDAVPLIPDLVTDYFANPKGSLVMSKCFPFNYQGKCVVLGDAAHAMVPFYGQGMNCGMEDVDVLDSMLDFLLPPGEKGRPEEGALEKAFDEYSKKRYPDVSTMIDLALYNYGEMREGVTNWRYLARKKIESLLHLLMPTRIIPLYTMVSFSQIPYSEVMRRWNAQTKMLETGAEIGIAAVVLGAAVLVAKLAGVKVGVGAAVQGTEKMWWFPWR